MKQAAVTMFLVLFSWIWNLVPWIASDLVPMARSSGPTTSFLANQALVTTGPKAITLKELNSSIRFSMWFLKRLVTTGPKLETAVQVKTKTPIQKMNKTT